MKFRTGALRALSLVIAPCLPPGGGQSLVAFNPARIIVFGDEAAIVAGSTPSDGRKYTINAFDTTNNVVNCGSNAIWIQVLALGYNISFPRSVGLPADSRVVGQIRALLAGRWNWRHRPTAQVTRQLALAPVDGGGITNTDLVTVCRVSTTSLPRSSATLPGPVPMPWSPMSSRWRNLWRIRSTASPRRAAGLSSPRFRTSASTLRRLAHGG